MKVIFLDIDGVLATPENWINGRADTSFKVGHLGAFTSPYGFNPECVKRFNNLCKETRATVILSSSWRILFPLNVMWEIFEHENVLFFPIARTSSDENTRGLQILSFLNKNKERLGIESFVALDDMFMPELGRNLVHTSFDLGLTDEDIQKAKQILDTKMETSLTGA